MKKRLLIMWLLASAIMLLLFAFTSCSHSHSFGEWCVERDSSCIEQGVVARICECGEKETDVISPKGHKSDGWITKKDSSCTEKGSEYQLCTVCNASFNETEIALKSHKSNDWVVDLQPTCTEAGYEHQVCTACNASFNEREILPSHLIQIEYTTAPTCTENGIGYNKCMVCDYTEVDKPRQIPATGHSYESFRCTSCLEYSVTVNELGTAYEDKNGLTVTLHSFTVTEHPGYYAYTIDYTVLNNKPDTKATPGKFKLYYEDGTYDSCLTGMELFYTETSNGTYTWKVLKTKKVVLLEYGYATPITPDEFHWFPPVIDAAPEQNP